MNYIEPLMDDRDERAGFKFADADLIGIPIKIILGKKVLQEGMIEIKIRKSGKVIKVAPEAVVDKVRDLIFSSTNT